MPHNHSFHYRGALYDDGADHYELDTPLTDDRSLDIDVAIAPNDTAEIELIVVTRTGEHLVGLLTLENASQNRGLIHMLYPAARPRTLTHIEPEQPEPRNMIDPNEAPVGFVAVPFTDCDDCDYKSFCGSAKPDTVFCDRARRKDKCMVMYKLRNDLNEPA
jgi:hypothetical protein